MIKKKLMIVSILLMGLLTVQVVFASGYGGTSLDDISRFDQGPCASQSEDECVFDTYTVFFDLNGDEWESITAVGKYWNFKNGVAQAGNGSDLTTVIRYMRILHDGQYWNGPCYGKSGNGCTFDTRTVFFDENDDKWESITAYGSYWNFKNGNPIAGNGNDLEQVVRYDDGPCDGQPSGACVFDSRTIFYDSYDRTGDKWESITADGAYWNFKNGVAQSGNGNDLTSVPRYMAFVQDGVWRFGPCYQESTGECEFDARSVVYDSNDDLFEHIIAYNHYWEYVNGTLQ